MIGDYDGPIREPIYGRRQVSDGFDTSPDQYDVSGSFGCFSPRFTIGGRFQDKLTATKFDYSGARAKQYSPAVPRSARVGTTTNRGVRQPTTSNSSRVHEPESARVKRIELPPMPRYEAIYVDGERRPNFAVVKRRVVVREPTVEFDGSTYQTARMNTQAQGPQPINVGECGPIGTSEYRHLPRLATGSNHVISNRETANLVR